MDGFYLSIEFLRRRNQLSLLSSDQIQRPDAVVSIGHNQSIANRIEFHAQWPTANFFLDQTFYTFRKRKTDVRSFVLNYSKSFEQQDKFVNQINCQEMEKY